MKRWLGLFAISPIGAFRFLICATDWFVVPWGHDFSKLSARKGAVT